MQQFACRPAKACTARLCTTTRADTEYISDPPFQVVQSRAAEALPSLQREHDGGQGSVGGACISIPLQPCPARRPRTYSKVAQPSAMGTQPPANTTHSSASEPGQVAISVSFIVSCVCFPLESAGHVWPSVTPSTIPACPGSTSPSLDNPASGETGAFLPKKKRKSSGPQPRNSKPRLVSFHVERSASLGKKTRVLRGELP